MGSKYIESSLMPGENAVHVAQISIIGTILGFIMSAGFFLIIALIILVNGGSQAAGFAILPLLLGVLILILGYIRYVSIECALTSKRVVAKFGFIRRRTIELDLRRTESIRLEQGILGRILNFGSVVVSGSGNPQAPIPGIKAPQEFRKQFLALQEHALEAGK